MRNLLVTCSLVVLVTAAGCDSGPKRVILKGKVTNNGTSLVPDRKGGVTMVFLPIPPTGNTFPAGVDPLDGSYTVLGPDQKGMPLGKYRVYVSVMMEKMTPETERMNSNYTERNTPIEVEITGPELDIDVAKFPPKK
jgi:hypothetical protein